MHKLCVSLLSFSLKNQIYFEKSLKTAQIAAQTAAAVFKLKGTFLFSFL